PHGRLPPAGRRVRGGMNGRPAPGRPPTGGTPGQTPQIPPRKSWLIFLAIVLGNYLLVRLLFPGAGEPMSVPYTVFKAEAGKRNVEVTYSRGTSIEGRFAAPVTWPTAADAAAGQENRPPAPRRWQRVQPQTSQVF